MALFKKNTKKAKEEAKKIETKIQNKIKNNFAWRLLIAPHITEKATTLEEQNKYVFKIYKNANKSEIKEAVEGVYNVDVENVQIVNVHPKKRRIGKRGEGWRKGYKKAIVKIEKGQKIEVLSR